MNSTYVRVREVDGFPILAVLGYLTQESGDEICREAEPILMAGKTTLVIDFSQCPHINSTGIAAFYPLLNRVTLDFEGRVILYGLSDFNTRILSMSGIVPITELAPNEAAAIALAKLEGSKEE